MTSRAANETQAVPEAGRLSLSLDGDRVLHVVFVRLADRIGHRLELQANSQPARVIAESWEGATDDAWPVSPPLQQLHLEDRGGGQRVALLVGMAGRGHWSLVVEPTADRRGFLFDAACRLSAAPTQIGSAYRWHVPAADCAVELQVESPEALRIRSSSESPAAQSSTPMTLDDSHVTLHWQPPLPSLPATVRWRYQVIG
ncbi:MAG: hypothetical protein ACKOBW_09975 [Planctomycetota bacterium]